jgi:hypothetical protein
MSELPPPLTLCRYGDWARAAVVMGNCIGENGTVWCHDYKSGRRLDLNPKTLLIEPDQPGTEKLLSTIETWAESGKSDAAWWLGWWNEGKNHPKSVWYYIAAMRMNQGAHGWAFGRLLTDTYNPVMCSHVPEPSLDFLDLIQEFRQYEAGERKLANIQWGNWREAVAMAKKAVHTPREQAE